MANKPKRDEFSEKTKRELALRVGCVCSICYCPTIGPNHNGTGIIKNGDAAHITAAQDGGPRYDGKLTSTDRKSINNGIWLCKNHAHQVDHDKYEEGKLFYTEDMLRRHKKEAEENAYKALLNTPAFYLSLFLKQILLDDADQDELKKILNKDDNIEDVTEKIRVAALQYNETFQNAYNISVHGILLNLTLQNEVESAPTSIENVAKLVTSTKELQIIASPGMGKSITLMQLATEIFKIDPLVPVLIPLSEWASSNKTFFEFLLDRLAFRKCKKQHFMLLAYFGRLTLLLDGWNEVSSQAHKRINDEINPLKREYPSLGIVIAGRQPKSSLTEISIKIERLSIEQQMELAFKFKGDEGKLLINKARSIPKLRELISIPLYLKILLDLAADKHLPETKNEILNAFVEQHKNNSKNSELLRKKLFDRVDNVLIALASEMNDRTVALLDDRQARQIVTQTSRLLQEEGQITTPFEPFSVLNALVDSHLLICISSEDKKYSFQHQQFQEWYASFKVEVLMKNAYAGANIAKQNLKIEILNIYTWEESILFACERLSRKDDQGVKIIAHSIVETLGIDPILAAKMIFCSTEDVWSCVSETVLKFVKNWHVPNTIDRAVRFMIMSGKSDFSHYLWPLIANNDSQIYLRAIRAANVFHVSVLGLDAEKCLEKLPDNIRGDVISAIGAQVSFNELELILRLTKKDSNPIVVFKILAVFYFRRAVHCIEEILSSASDQVWQLLANDKYYMEYLSAAYKERFLKFRQERIKNEIDPIKKLDYLVEEDIKEPSYEVQVTELIQSSDFPIKSGEYIIDKAYKIYPKAVSEAILYRLLSRLGLPDRAHYYLKNITPRDNETIAAIVFEKGVDKSIAQAISVILGEKMVAQILTQCLCLAEKLHLNYHSMSEEEREEYQHLRSLIISSSLPVLILVLQQKIETENVVHIGVMADLLARHGNEYEEGTPFLIDVDKQECSKNILKKWINTVLSSPDKKQDQLSNLANVIRRISDPIFVVDLNKMLDWELEQRAKQFHPIVHRSRPVDYSTIYRKSFVSIGNEQVVTLMKKYLPNLLFGLEAAGVLYDIYNNNNSNAEGTRFLISNDFSKVRKNRALLNDSSFKPLSSEYAEEIFAVVRKLGISTADDDTQIHAIKLAIIGMKLPCGNKDDEFEMLLQLPQKWSIKQELIVTAAIQGKIISAKLLLSAVKEFLIDAEEQAWMLRNDNSFLITWLELFAFSDQPIDLMIAINSLPTNIQENLRLDRILQAFGHSLHPQALSVLQTLAERYQHIIKHVAWLKALLGLETEEAASYFIKLLPEGVMINNKSSVNDYMMIKGVLYLVKNFPSLQQKLLEYHKQTSDNRIRRAIQHCFVELADYKLILELIRNHSVEGQLSTFDFTRAIENIAISNEPVPNWPGAFIRVGISLSEFRQVLFDMLPLQGEKSRIAKKCLTMIDELRDQYGYVDDEPRHPNIFSEEPWPLVFVSFPVKPPRINII